MQRSQFTELLEFWSIVELYQNLYWKPFKLLGINLNIQIQKLPEENDVDEAEEEEDISSQTTMTTMSTAQVKEEDENEVRHTTLARVLANFTLGQEETLRKEIIAFYIADDAPSQICLPSQARDQLLLIAARASEMKNEDSLKIFRQAQRYCYDEMQRIHMPLFVQDELLKAGQPPKRVRYRFIYICYYL